MLTCVSAYFPVKNKHDNKYLKCFIHLKILSLLEWIDFKSLTVLRLIYLSVYKKFLLWNSSPLSYCLIR